MLEGGPIQRSRVQKEGLRDVKSIHERDNAEHSPKFYSPLKMQEDYIFLAFFPSSWGHVTRSLNDYMEQRLPDSICEHPGLVT